MDSRRIAAPLTALPLAVGLVACGAGGGVDSARSSAPPTTIAASASASPLPASAAPAQAGVDVDDPASPTVVVNKRRPLSPTDWAPTALSAIPDQDMRLRPEAAAAAGELITAAAADGIGLRALSGYRSYGYQVSTYQHWVDELGAAEADRVSARPGHSEHQTGLAWDVGAVAAPACDLEACFGQTDAGRWVAAHAAEHGFIVRYPQGAEAVTGFAYEPWHLRFVGEDLAALVSASGRPLETVLGLPSAPDYRD